MIGHEMEQDDEKKRAMDQTERVLRDALRADDARAAVSECSLEARGLSPQEVRLVDDMRRQVDAIDGNAGSERRRSRNAIVRATDRRDVPGRPHLPGALWGEQSGAGPRWAGLAAAAVLIAALGSGALALRERLNARAVSEPEASEGVYLGDKTETRSRVDPLPATLDWSEEVSAPGPFSLVVVDLERKRVDETREVFANPIDVDEFTWSCSEEQRSMLPELFRIEVYSRADPPGADPVWERAFVRP